MGLAGALLVSTAGALAAQAAKDRVLILVVDGLRPDYVTAELMPRLNALAESGVRGLRHHAVFPTVTRVNGPSIFTGRHPGGHGILGNSVYLPAIDPSRVLSAADVQDLRAIDRGSRGGLLTTPSLGELLADGGRVLFAASSGSAGSGSLMNHRGAGAGLVHHDVTIPDTLAEVVRAALGPVPAVPDGAPAIPLVARVVDAVLLIGVDRADADVLAAWLTEPDGTVHDRGIGSREMVTVLREVDAEIGRLLDGLEERGVLERTNVLATSDHGFSTRVGTQSLEALLVSAGLKASPESLDVVVAGDAIHVREGGRARVARIVRLLQETPWVGPVFSGPASEGSDEGRFPGTISYAAIGWSHDRSADLLTSAGWSDASNQHGWAGTALTPGVAGHGTSSPWDIRATFIAAGPAIKRGVASEVPTGNIDITPTALRLVGVRTSTEFDGRVLDEILRGGPDPSSVRVTPDSVSAEADHSRGTYRMTVLRSRVGRTVYFGGTRIERTTRARSERGAVRPPRDLQPPIRNETARLRIGKYRSSPGMFSSNSASSASRASANAGSPAAGPVASRSTVGTSPIPTPRSNIMPTRRPSGLPKPIPR
jgi:arylsulfatase A-like enzyme